ncbi:TPA: hypothetical protein ACGPA6_001408 [Streptococcus suis]
MKYEIVIDFIVDSEIKFIDTIQYEYYKASNGQIYYDEVQFEEGRISIRGNRTQAIDLENCWKSTKSNYKRCMLSSIFYVYNVYKQPIKIQSITMTADGFIQPIPFSQEFTEQLPADFAIDSLLIKNYLFKPVSQAELSNMLFRVLHPQVLYCRQKDFYSAYRLFNSVYTYMYRYHNDFKQKNGDKRVDKEAIKDILKNPEITRQLQKSIPLAKEFFLQNTKEIRSLLYTWIISEKIGPDSLSGIICYEDFGYKNGDVLQTINTILENYYQVPSIGKMPQHFKSFKARLQRNQLSADTNINYLQLIVLCAQYRRNKILHGENVDSTFFISDINAEILENISDIVFQLGIDLVNHWDESDYITVPL